MPKGTFLAKYTPQGNPVWAKSATWQANSLFTDPAGNCYVTGKFYDSLAVGGTMLYANGKVDIFVAKFDSAGSLIWATRAGGPGNPPGFPSPPLNFQDGGFNIIADAAGNSYISATVMISVNLPAYFDTFSVYSDPGHLTWVMLNVLVKYNASGQVEWVQKLNKNLTINPVSLAISSQGDCYFTASYTDTLTIGNTNLISNGLNDVYYAKLNSAGNLVWLKSFGSAEHDFAQSIHLNQQGDLMISGGFRGTFTIGGNTLTNTSGNTSLFLIKCDDLGNPIWASQTTGSGNTGNSLVTTDSAGISYVSSHFSGNISIGQQNFTSSNLPNSGYNFDVLVSKWDAAGLPVWAVTAQGIGHDLVRGMVLSHDQNSCYLTGTFNGGLQFGNQHLSTGNNSAFYLARLDNIVTAAPEELSNILWSVHPNPAHNQLHLNLPHLTGKVQAQLTDVRGQNVYFECVATPYAVLELPKLAAGMYVLTVKSEGQILRSKVVIK